MSKLPVGRDGSGRRRKKTRSSTLLRKLAFRQTLVPACATHVCPSLSGSLRLVANLYSLTGVNLYAYWGRGVLVCWRQVLSTVSSWRRSGRLERLHEESCIRIRNEFSLAARVTWAAWLWQGAPARNPARSGAQAKRGGRHSRQTAVQTSSSKTATQTRCHAL